MTTEQCQHPCLMCSQPPKIIDDQWLLEEANELIRMMPRSTAEFGFSGGEPTLFGNDFLEILNIMSLLLSLKYLSQNSTDPNNIGE